MKSNSPGKIGNAALITAAGNSFRMGGEGKKEFRLIGGKPVLLRAVESFMTTGLFQKILVTHRPEGKKETEEVLKSVLDENFIIFTQGGETRQESVYRGLEALKYYNPSFVLIHDGARPWIDTLTIKNTLEMTIKKGAAAPVIPDVNALKVVGKDGVIYEHLKRGYISGVQTPQGFRFPEILAAHVMAKNDGVCYIDDTEIYSRYAGPVYTIPGDPGNIKITFPADLMEERI